MVEVIPAIMPKSYSDIAEKVSRVSSFVSLIQLDPMDGKFVPEKTWPYLSYDDSDFVALLSEEKGLPEWNTIDYEIDLMSETPESDAFDWIRIGARRIILHVESTEELPKLIAEIRSEFGSPREGSVSPEIGIAANNDTRLSEWEELIPFVDFVQVMGIARIGYQGEPFDVRAIDRIRTLRGQFPELIISVDGGVNGETAPRLVEAGADRLVSGSYIFKSEHIGETIESLKALGGSS